MNMKQSYSLPYIGFIGGDMRQVYAYEYIKNKNFPVSAYSLSGGITSDSLPDILKNASVLVGGIPFSKDSKTLFLSSAPFQKNAPIEIDYFLSCLFHSQNQSKSRMLFAGKIPKKVKEFCSNNHIIYHDFLEDETFAAANALPTAEGAIMEAIALGNTVLEDQKCLVLGYGRCGSVLAQKLKALSADVTIYTRHSEQKTYFENMGFHFYDDQLPSIRNTSPKTNSSTSSHKVSNQTESKPYDKILHDADKPYAETLYAADKPYDKTLYAADQQYNEILYAADIEHSPHSSLSEYTYIFNTVPSLLLDSNTLSQLSPDTVIIDIASAPGGIDYNAVSSYPVHARHLLGIPGKIAPKYAGELIAQTILSSIDETGL